MKDLEIAPKVDWLGPSSLAVMESFKAVINVEPENSSERFHDLYLKGMGRAWLPQEVLPLHFPLDPDNPLGSADRYIPLYGSTLWSAMSTEDQGLVRRHFQAWTLSQFYYGEQAGMVAAAKLVQQLPNLELKLAASVQVLDEARHSYIYSALMNKLAVRYPISRSLQSLLVDSIQDKRWDITSLGLQTLVEGFALAMFVGIREKTNDPLIKSVMVNISADEARHIALGQIALGEAYTDLSQPEKLQRQEFVMEACETMIAHLDAAQVWRELGLPEKECCRITRDSPLGVRNRRGLFKRVVPLIRSVGLLDGPLSKYFMELGVYDY
ncbi:MAG: ferritin-like domain-containing protein [Sediminibacterium sp.]|jgi:hypothetical protein|nr:ferritin-like domain-containing protein [Sediminibacterium sp.]